MTARPAQERSFQAGLAVILLVGAFLAFRAGQAVRAVMGERRLIENTHSSPAAPPLETAGLSLRDSMVAEAAPGLRDPFRVRAYSGPSRISAASARAPAAPALRALLFDNVNPTVKVSVGDETSGWLHEGDTFLGWTVNKIETTSVQMTSGSDSIRLTTS